MARDPNAPAHTQSEGGSIKTLIRASVFVSVTLLLLLVTIAFTSAWFFKKLDDDYSALVEKTSSALKNVQAVTVHAETIFTSISDLIVTADGGERAKILKKIDSERALNDELYAKVAGAITDPKVLANFEEIRVRRVTSHPSYLDLVRLVEEGKCAEAAELRTKKILPAFHANQEARERLCGSIESWANAQSDLTSESVKNLRRGVVGLAIVPVVLALLLAGLLIGLGLLIGGTSHEHDLLDGERPSPGA